MLGSLPEVPELPGYGVGQQKLASRHGLHLHINRLAGSHHRIVVHLELLNATRRQKPICRVEEEGIDLYGLSIGRMGCQVDVAGVGGPGVAQIIHQVLGAGTGAGLGQLARLHKEHRVVRLHGIGRRVPRAV